MFATLSLSVALTAQALESEVWISPNGPATTNGVSGAPYQPFRCPDPTSLNTVLASTLNANDLTIHFMAGTFLIPSNGIVPLPGWKLRGAGIGNTILKFQTNVLNSGTSESMIQNGPSNADAVEVSDLTVDCNVQNQSASNLRIGAVSLIGNDTRISRVKAINWGTSLSGGECFVLVIQPQPGTFNPITNCIIEDCIVTTPAPIAFADGATCIGIFVSGPDGPGYVQGAIMRNNLVMNIPSGISGLGIPRYVNAYGAGGTIERNQALNLPNGSAAYADSWNMRDVLIKDNVFDNIKNGVNFNMYWSSVTDLIIKNNLIKPAEGGTGISLAFYTNTIYASNVVIQANTIYPSSTATNVTALGLWGTMNVTVMNNVLQGGGNGSDFFVNWPGDPLSANTLNITRWSDNVNFAGTQLVEANSGSYQPGEEDTIAFMPTNSGWYRVMTGENSMAADINIFAQHVSSSDFWSTTDMDVGFQAHAWDTTTNMGVFNVIRQGSDGFPVSDTGNVDGMRIVTDSPNSPMLYLDVHVVSPPQIWPIYITAKGWHRSRLQLNPTTPTAPTYYKQLTF
jgi:hypothetical protein